MTGLPVTSSLPEVEQKAPLSITAPLMELRAVSSMGQNDHDNNRDDDDGTGLATKTRSKTKRPSLYRVLLLNDDYTPMDFVVEVLRVIFNKSSEAAWEITMHVHKHGVGECGVFPFEVAETKVTIVLDAARKNQHPLQCVMEKQ